MTIENASRLDAIHTRLDAIRSRLNAATPGPWKARHRFAGASDSDDEKAGLGWEIEGPPEATLRGQFSRAADAHLIAHAPEDIAALLEVADAILQVAGAHRTFDGEGSYSAKLRRLNAALDELQKEVPS